MLQRTLNCNVRTDRLWRSFFKVFECEILSAPNDSSQISPRISREFRCQNFTDVCLKQGDDGLCILFLLFFNLVSLRKTLKARASTVFTLLKFGRFLPIIKLTVSKKDAYLKITCCKSLAHSMLKDNVLISFNYRCRSALPVSHGFDSKKLH